MEIMWHEVLFAKALRNKEPNFPISRPIEYSTSCTETKSKAELKSPVESKAKSSSFKNDDQESRIRTNKIVTVSFI